MSIEKFVFFGKCDKIIIKWIKRRKHMDKNKPRVFIGSSVESLDIAQAIQQYLNYEFYCDIWTQGIFKASTTALDSLISELKNFDFAIFVFGGEDVTKIRNIEYNSTRDNIIFETGLFMGKLGRERVFYIAPDNVKIHMPTDLNGFEAQKYQAQHPNIIASVATACMSIKMQMNKLGDLKNDFV